jgi:hypothetical protein
MDWRNTTVVTNCVYQRVSAKWSNDPDDLGVAVDETSIWTSCRVFNWVKLGFQDRFCEILLETKQFSIRPNME